MVKTYPENIQTRNYMEESVLASQRKYQHPPSKSTKNISYFAKSKHFMKQTTPKRRNIHHFATMHRRCEHKQIPRASKDQQE
ncbi:MAG: hypothetical protein CL920_26130 [Deltaproteobacteria bacterium]|nr:hypothetical protein [Deltaproteobacteria bacterium]